MAKIPSTPAEAKSYLDDIESWLVATNKKYLPVMPAPWRELLVKFAPWLIILSCIVSLPIILAALGLSALFLPAGLLLGAGTFMGIVRVGLTVFMLVLELMALPALFKRQRRGWRLLLYATFVSMAQSLLTMSFISLIVGGGIGLYLLMQTRDLYTTKA
jgi:hypothetical protein